MTAEWQSRLRATLLLPFALGACRTRLDEFVVTDAPPPVIDAALVVSGVANDLMVGAGGIDFALPENNLDLSFPQSTDLAAHNGMVSVPAGGFLMGCNALVDKQCTPVESPYHRVMLSAFDIDQTEVTEQAYKACMVAGACTAPVSGPDPKPDSLLPVIEIDWYQASAYCAFVGKRLPTEAEWEKAARGTDGRIYPWGDALPDCDHANLFHCGNDLQPVGSHPKGASPYGALDMAGNAQEFVFDWFAADYYLNSPLTDPKGPAHGITKATRGGYYNSLAPDLRVSARDSGNVVFGVRCAR